MRVGPGLRIRMIAIDKNSGPAITMQEEVLKRIKFDNRRSTSAKISRNRLAKPALYLEPLKAAKQHTGTEVPFLQRGIGPPPARKSPGVSM